VELDSLFLPSPPSFLSPLFIQGKGGAQEGRSPRAGGQPLGARPGCLPLPSHLYIHGEGAPHKDTTLS
jgi:hypothetical protein